jgi:DNA-binding HxlR family transcriptional regulator
MRQVLLTQKHGDNNMKYRQFCPTARAMEVLGERWTVF